MTNTSYNTSYTADYNTYPDTYYNADGDQHRLHHIQTNKTVHVRT